MAERVLGAREVRSCGTCQSVVRSLPRRTDLRFRPSRGRLLGGLTLFPSMANAHHGCMETETEFEAAMAGLRATGASAAATEVVKALDRHGREEGEILARYERFVEDADSPVAQYLVRLIVDEERRHHRMLEELANTIAWGYLGDEDQPTVPHVPLHADYNREFRAETRALLHHELVDRKQLRHLERKVRRFGDVPMWQLLIELLRRDTEKHISILRFIQNDNRRHGMRGTLARARVRWQRIRLSS